MTRPARLEPGGGAWKPRFNALRAPAALGGPAQAGCCAFNPMPRIRRAPLYFARFNSSVRPMSSANSLPAAASSSFAFGSRSRRLSSCRQIRASVCIRVMPVEPGTTAVGAKLPRARRLPTSALFLRHGKHAVDLRDHGRALAHGGGDAFGRSGPHIADSEDAG